MKNYRELLNKYLLKPISYKKLGNTLIIDVKDAKYVVKPKIRNPNIYEYLNSRTFDYYPRIINEKDDDFEISEFIENKEIPEEQKLEEMVKLVALLHSKTTYYEKHNVADNKEIYEIITNNVNYLKSYYLDMITLIETKTFMSPAEYLFARNISKIMDSLSYAEEQIEKWYKSVENNASERLVVIHNNLDLSHFIYNENKYLLSWRKSKFGKPIFDLFAIFNKYANKYDFKDLLAIYESIYPLKEEEKSLLYIMISLPPKIDFTINNYDLCQQMSQQISLLYVKDKIILPEDFKNAEEN